MKNNLDTPVAKHAAHYTQNMQLRRTRTYVRPIKSCPQKQYMKIVVNRSR